MAHVHGAAAKAVSHGAHAAHGVATLTKAKHVGAAVGIAAATQTHTGKGFMSVFSKHPFWSSPLVLQLGTLPTSIERKLLHRQHAQLNWAKIS